MLAALAAASFQSTHPVWGGTTFSLVHSFTSKISIHPPRVGWDFLVMNPQKCLYAISIHPPRVGWDDFIRYKSINLAISIHPPRVGWDLTHFRHLI